MEMVDMQVQTEGDSSEEKAEDNLIRLQSSMSLLQEDFNRERKMLNDRIAQGCKIINFNNSRSLNYSADLASGWDFFRDPESGLFILARLKIPKIPKIWKKFRVQKFCKITKTRELGSRLGKRKKSRVSNCFYSEYRKSHNQAD